MRAILHVCTTCRGQLAAPADADRTAGTDPADPDAPRAGSLLHRALAEADLPEGVELRAVECLSACNQGCSVALSAPGKWSYVYGRLGPADAPEILAGAGAYALAADGLVPWRARPVIFRKQSLARIPPLTPALE